MKPQIQGPNSVPVGESAHPVPLGVSSPTPQGSDGAYDWPEDALMRVMAAISELDGVA